eukprot:TRINITY_DN33935_c0_g1_i1.p1 TRINITY_DN33935_c0_g1~~TRINITY_DN33935_c0_g1_i1.p1  ORF type:complete len:682 (+),score=121.72 TRINITY_DN33935_c0_g1_i1:157-2202(+)
MIGISEEDTARTRWQMLMFFVLVLVEVSFFLGRSSDSITIHPFPGDLMTEKNSTTISMIHTLLKEPSPMFPQNISAIHMGSWHQIMKTEVSDLEKKMDDMSPVFVKESISNALRVVDMPLIPSTGKFHLDLTAKPVRREKNIHVVKGHMDILVGNNLEYRFLLSGVYIQPTGQLTFFTKPPEGQHIDMILLPKQNNTISATTKSKSTIQVGHSSSTHEEVEHGSQKKSNFRPKTGITYFNPSKCMFEARLQAVPRKGQSLSSLHENIFGPSYHSSSKSQGSSSGSNTIGSSTLGVDITGSGDVTPDGKHQKSETNVSLEDDNSRQLLHHLYFDGILTSENCGIDFAIDTRGTRVELTQFRMEVKVTAIIAVVASILDCMVFVKQIHHTDSNRRISNMSLYTIGMKAMIDFYICFFFLVLAGIGGSLYNLVAFMRILQFGLFDTRYFLMIWKSKEAELGINESHPDFRFKAIMINVKFYVAICLGFVLMFQLKRYLLFLILGIYCIWIPQIIANAIDNVRRAVSPYFSIGHSLFAIITPSLIFGIEGSLPQQVFGLPYSWTFLYFLYAILLIQTVVIILQDRLKPRFFVPKRFLPKRYDYHQKLPAKVVSTDASTSDIQNAMECGVLKSIDCSICITSVDMEHSGKYMLTPCGHLFHKSCLLEWMNIRLECPTCRTAIPSVD